MPMPACIFCPKSHGRPNRSALLRVDSGGRGPTMGSRVALPVFNGRVSPVLDSCTRLYVLESSGIARASNQTLRVKGTSIFERVGELKRIGIKIIICGALSESFYNLLREAGIELVCGITGEIEEVIDAYRNGTLGHARFQLPGFE